MKIILLTALFLISNSWAAEVSPFYPDGTKFNCVLDPQDGMLDTTIELLSTDGVQYAHYTSFNCYEGPTCEFTSMFGVDDPKTFFMLQKHEVRPGIRSLAYRDTKPNTNRSLSFMIYEDRLMMYMSYIELPYMYYWPSDCQIQE